MLSWDDLRFFLAVHRTGSHAAAARALRVASTTIGRRIVALEEAAGARLFARTPDGLVATASGLALVPHAERVEAEVLDAERELEGADTRPTGTVRLTCGDGFASYVLAPALPAFLAEHPGLVVEVVAAIRALDLSRGEADVALRLFRPRERSLVARRIGTERYGLFASPAYLARRGAPRTPADLAAHDLVLFDHDLDRLKSQVWLRELAPDARVAVRASTTTAMYASCANGCGIAVVMQSVARRDPRFAPVLPRLEPPSNELWAVIHGDLKGSARVAAVVRLLEKLVREWEG